MSVRHLVVGTAGHIDHGKTALVRALTGVDTDRSPEEKRRGITIDLGFAAWRLSHALQASIVDVPGHESLVRTMVAGAVGMDLALLLVAADDGVMPQTREHLDVLELLGVRTGIVVLTKVDLADDELLSLVEDDVRDLVAGGCFAEAPIVRVSSKTGHGVDELAAAVQRVAQRIPPRSAEGPPFLPIDRVFHKPGHGTIVTGTLLRGTLSVGDTVEAWGAEMQASCTAKVRALQVIGDTHGVVRAGTRIAVNIASIAGKTTPRRGMTLVLPDTFRAAKSAIVRLRVLPGAPRLPRELMFHAGTAERVATLQPLTRDNPEAALLRFHAPLALFAGQRFVLRCSGDHGLATCGGGEVLDPGPPRGRGALAMAREVAPLLLAGGAQRSLAVVRASRALGLSHSQAFWRLPQGETPGDGTLYVVGAPPRWVAAEHVGGIVDTIVRRVAERAARSPLSPGLTEPELASQLPPPDAWLCGRAIEMACDAGRLTRDGAFCTLPGRRVGDAASEHEMRRLYEVFTAAGLAPPFDTELGGITGLPGARIADLLALLRKEQLLTRVGQTLHVATLALRDLQARLCAELARGGELGAPAFKALAGGISRKWAIPLLEYFDRSRVTVRVGDARRLGPAGAVSQVLGLS